MSKATSLVAVIFISVIIAYIFFGKNSSDSVQKESLVIKGSDTEVQMVSNLSEAFLERNPGADISVTGGGSGVGIAALLNKEIDIANSSRAIKQDEQEQAKNKGLDVQEFILALDSLSIIVHPQNKIEDITVDDLGKIYKGEITNWNEVGGTDGKIILYGRQSTSGTYIFFRDYVVKDDYSQEMKSMEGNQAIIDAVKSDVNGIGYSGVGYVKDENDNPRKDIKVLSVAKTRGAIAISPLNKEAVAKEEYPITRQIFQYLSNVPAKNSLMEKFLHFESSDEGRKIIEKSGFYPVSEAGMKQNQLLFEKIQ